ncbi:MAG: hypothetical protein AVDCRST_MAG50-2904, partial [uncultured Acidimicrobiales bacterium]
GGHGCTVRGPQRDHRAHRGSRGARGGVPGAARRGRPLGRLPRALGLARPPAPWALRDGLAVGVEGLLQPVHAKRRSPAISRPDPFRPRSPPPGRLQRVRPRRPV